MFVTCWSSKGGSGTTVVSAALAVLLDRQSDAGVLLVDLAGDLPSAMGFPEPSGPGLAGWFAAGPSVPPDGLGRLEVAISDRMSLLPRGEGLLGPYDRAEALAELLAAETRSVVVDAGIPSWGPANGSPAAAVLAASSSESFAVTRACYLSLRRLVAAPLRPSGVVLVVEAGRALGRLDIEQVLGVDVVAEVVVDPAVARAVDAGLLAGRLPRSLERALGKAA
ncbi:MAG: hypothetical protein WCK41_04215 [Actinomycetes bacterium]